MYTKNCHGAIHRGGYFHEVLNTPPLKTKRHQRERDGQFGMNTPRGRQSLQRVKPTEATMLRWTRTRYAVKLQVQPLLWQIGCAGGEAQVA